MTSADPPRTAPHAAMIFKVMGKAEWQEAKRLGRYDGSPDDRRDGFIHFSAGEQLPGTLAKYFAGREDLVLLAVEAAALGDALKWEPSRGGALFPHLYRALEAHEVTREAPLPLSPTGTHRLPDWVGVRL